MPFRLPTTEEKADYVLQQFDRIASRYDLTNDVISFGMHRLWKERAVTELGLKPDGAYLDVCCGTGDLTLTIAKRLPALGSVTGLDFSGNMLDVARNRESRARADHNIQAKVAWCQGDAQNLPFDDNTFDGAIVSFGLRNLTDLQKGICEMARVVKPGAKVLNLDLGHPSVPIFAPLYKFYFSRVVPIVGDIIQNDRKAYTYLPESLTSYPKPEGITQLMRNAGLTDIKHIPLAMGSVALHCGTVP